jgi:hypothetical protein
VAIIQDFQRVLDRLSQLRLIIAEQVWKDAMAETQPEATIGRLLSA